MVGDVLELERSDCELPNVSWIVPNAKVSEHPQALVSTGQAYVTTLINSIMRSPCWGSTAMFLSWDDWGGFYDNVVPPDIDENGYGFRVPGLVISRPMAVRIPVRTYVKKPGVGEFGKRLRFLPGPAHAVDQDMRLHDGRVYLTLGCNMECSLYAHGHLNLTRGRRHLGLRSVLTTLEPGHATRIALSLSHANLSAVHRALEQDHSVKAAVEVEAASGAERRTYSVEVRLSWR